jgi:Fe2+ transport system protein B
MDLEEKREVSYDEAASLAKSYGLPYIECSAKSGHSVEETFTKLARMMKEKNIDQAIQGSKLTEPLHISFTDKDTSRRKCCSN